MATVEIRPAVDSDLAALVSTFQGRHFFADALARQRSGRGVLLVAWLDDGPVGDVYVSLEPVREPRIRAHLPGVPQFGHLEVLSTLWRQGIGTALIQAAEGTARRLGHHQVTLSVGLDNPGARRLYERLGYAAWGHGPVVERWQEFGNDGTPVTVSEVCEVLVKRLSSGGGQ
jgi:GNAT superfamily N-acetyltransferase